MNGGNGFWDYPTVNLKDPKLLDTARKVKCVVASNNEWERVDKGAGIEIETTDGRHIKQIVPFSKGLPENPLSKDEVREKFHSLVDPVLPGGRSSAIVDAVDKVQNIGNIDDLVQLLIVPPAKRLTSVAGGKR